MPQVRNTNWTWGIWTEAAGNSATLSAIGSIAPVDNRYTADGANGGIEWDHDVWINGFVTVGDVASLTEITLDHCEFAGNRYVIDLFENLPAETSTARASGWHDYRHSPIRLPAGNNIRAMFAEDASTNLEPLLAALFSWPNPVPLNKAVTYHMPGPETAFDLRLAQTTTTAATWTLGTNLLGANNAQAIKLADKGTYVCTRLRTNGAASLKCIELVMGTEDIPGVIGAVDSNVQEIPVFDATEYCPIVATGAEWNNAKIRAYDIDGSTTPSLILTMRRIA